MLIPLFDFNLQETAVLTPISSFRKDNLENDRLGAVRGTLLLKAQVLATRTLRKSRISTFRNRKILRDRFLKNAETVF